VGVVAIGRNEGERLRKCLESVSGRDLTVVYVDSASDDGSTELARSLGADVVDLDLSRPFSAARARNEGFARLVELVPDTAFVQFVDGDCEFVDGWMERARQTLEARPEVAVVCGRLRERAPELSIYNRLADLEWDTPIGEVALCGGIAMMRVSAFRAAGGFNPALIAGEEPELCLRLRRDGWKILRIDAEMALHDMAMYRFRQWWNRSVRSGHAYAEGAALHGLSPERHWVREVKSIVAWGIALPVAIILLAWPTRGFGLLLFLIYPLQAARIALRSRRRGLNRRDAALYGSVCTIGKFANAVGLCRYWLGRGLRRRRGAPIEYK
jgi:GT2 family glycosyltransferase